MQEDEEGEEEVTGMKEDVGSGTFAIDIDEKGETEEEPEPNEEASPTEKQPTRVLFQLNNRIPKRLQNVSELRKVLQNTPKTKSEVKRPVFVMQTPSLNPSWADQTEEEESSSSRPQSENRPKRTFSFAASSTSSSAPKKQLKTFKPPPRKSQAFPQEQVS